MRKIEGCDEGEYFEREKSKGKIRRDTREDGGKSGESKRLHVVKSPVNLAEGVVNVSVLIIQIKPRRLH